MQDFLISTFFSALILWICHMAYPPADIPILIILVIVNLEEVWSEK